MIGAQLTPVQLENAVRLVELMPLPQRKAFLDLLGLPISRCADWYKRANDTWVVAFWGDQIPKCVRLDDALVFVVDHGRSFRIYGRRQRFLYISSNIIPLTRHCPSRTVSIKGTW